MSTQCDGGRLQARKRALTKNQIWGHLDLAPGLWYFVIAWDKTTLWSYLSLNLIYRFLERKSDGTHQLTFGIVSKLEEQSSYSSPFWHQCLNFEWSLVLSPRTRGSGAILYKMGVFMLQGPYEHLAQGFKFSNLDFLDFFFNPIKGITLSIFKK